MSSGKPNSSGPSSDQASGIPSYRSSSFSIPCPTSDSDQDLGSQGTQAPTGVYQTAANYLPRKSQSSARILPATSGTGQRGSASGAGERVAERISSEHRGQNAGIRRREDEDEGGGEDVDEDEDEDEKEHSASERLLRQKSLRIAQDLQSWKDRVGIQSADQTTPLLRRTSLERSAQPPTLAAPTLPMPSPSPSPSPSESAQPPATQPHGQARHRSNERLGPVAPNTSTNTSATPVASSNTNTNTNTSTSPSPKGTAKAKAKATTTAADRASRVAALQTSDAEAGVAGSDTRDALWSHGRLHTGRLVTQLAWLAVTLSQGLLFPFFTMGQSSPNGSTDSDWYGRLDLPRYAPPIGVHYGALAVICFLHARAGWLVWRRGGLARQAPALFMFFASFSLYQFWTLLFFCLHSVATSLPAAFLLVINSYTTTLMFNARLPRAALLLVPGNVWFTFLTVFTLHTLVRNAD